MLVWDLDENDADPVGISDPHLEQAPRFPLGWTHDLDTGRLEALMLDSEIPHLQPEGQLAGLRPIADAGDFQEASTEEEDEPRIVAVTELTVDSKTESVAIETSTAVQVRGPEQDSAAEYVHTSDHARATA